MPSLTNVTVMSQSITFHSGIKKISVLATVSDLTISGSTVSGSTVSGSTKVVVLQVDTVEPTPLGPRASGWIS